LRERIPRLLTNKSFVKEKKEKETGKDDTSLDPGLPREKRRKEVVLISSSAASQRSKGEKEVPAQRRKKGGGKRRQSLLPS